VPIASVRAVIPLLTFLIVGCGASFSEVSGKVTYNAHPLASGNVMFLASDGRPYDAPIDAAGNYVLRKMPIGLARIAVNCLMPVARDGTDAAKKTESRVGSLNASNPKTASAIPLRYGDFADSKLVVTIQSGRMTHDIELAD
jgi:hypothetical protein